MEREKQEREEEEKKRGIRTEEEAWAYINKYREKKKERGGRKKQSWKNKRNILKICWEGKRRKEVKS